MSGRYLLYPAVFAALLSAQPRYDQGPVEPSFALRAITLLLKPTPKQQADLDRLLAEQQDPASPNYHRWLTPEEYAASFGVTAERTGEIRRWLEAQGFHVSYTARARNWIAFDGTAGQIAKAFDTKIHRFLADGETHFSNTAPPSIPAALADVAAGLRGLDDFRLKPLG